MGVLWGARGQNTKVSIISFVKWKVGKRSAGQRGKLLGVKKWDILWVFAKDNFLKPHAFAYKSAMTLLHMPGRRGLSQWSLERLPCSERPCYSLLLRLHTMQGNLFCSVQHLGTYKIQRGRDHIRQLLCGTQLICRSLCVQLAIRSLYPEGFSFD